MRDRSNEAPEPTTFSPNLSVWYEKRGIARSGNKPVQTKILHDIPMLWFSVNTVSTGGKDIIYWEVSKYDLVKIFVKKQLLKSYLFS